MRYIRWKLSDIGTGQNEGWIGIAFELILCVVCPYLLITYWILRGKSGNARISFSEIFVNAQYVLLFFILLASPICVVLFSVTWGIQQAFAETGIFFAVVFVEIHIALSFALNHSVRKRLGLIERVAIEKSSLVVRHPIVAAIGIITVCAGFFALMLNEQINNFWAYILGIYGNWLFLRNQTRPVSDDLNQM